jgi:hypothetical protein
MIKNKLLQKRRLANGVIGEQFLHAGSSYLRIPKDNFILAQGNLHSFCKVPHSFDETRVTKNPSFLKRLFHTFF